MSSKFILSTVVFISILAVPSFAAEPAAYVRVSQIGYESGAGALRAYLMSTASETGGTFQVLNSNDQTVFMGPVGTLQGTWTHSDALVYQVYALDFTVPAAATYSIAVTGPVPAFSPVFAVSPAPSLYSGLLLNTLFFYETERDGPNYVPNVLTICARSC